MQHAEQIVRLQLPALLPRLRRFARALAHHAHDADDLVQVAVERALTRATQWRPDTRLENWMFGIIRNAWIDEARARSRRSKLFVSDEQAENIGVDAMAAQSDTLSVQSAMTHLPEEQRTAVALVLVAGLSYHEAAEVMGTPIGTLTSRLARGREALQKILGDSRGTAR